MSTTTLTTVLAIIQAIGVSVGAYITTALEDGSINFKSPVFWIGLFVAAAMALKGYWTQGTPEAGKPAIAPTMPPAQP